MVELVAFAEMAKGRPGNMEVKARVTINVYIRPICTWLK